MENMGKDNQHTRNAGLEIVWDGLAELPVSL